MIKTQFSLFGCLGQIVFVFLEAKLQLGCQRALVFLILRDHLTNLKKMMFELF